MGCKFSRRGQAMRQEQGKGNFSRGEFCPRRGVGVPESVQAEGCHRQPSVIDSSGSFAGRLERERTEHRTTS